MPDRAVVFGGSGALGAACVAELERGGVDVMQISHSLVVGDPDWARRIAEAPANRIVWAQGRNAGGGIADGDLSDVEALLDSNVLFIVRTMRALLDAGAVSGDCRVVILRSLAADLGPMGVAVNAVAPGVIDTPMARANLTASQISQFEASTPARELCSPNDVARVVSWLSSSESRGVNAATIPVDGGWSAVRYV